MTPPEPARRPSLAEAAVHRSLSQRQSVAEDSIGRLIEAGRHLMSDGRNPRVADIVEAAGLSNDAFYRYFPSKDEFVSAVIEDGALRLLLLVERRMAEHETPSGQLEAAVDAVMSQAGDESVAASTRHILARSHGQQNVMRARVESELAALLVDPLVGIGSTDPDRDSLAAATVIFGRLVMFILDGHTTTPADVAHLCGYITAGSRR